VHLVLIRHLNTKGTKVPQSTRSKNASNTKLQPQHRHTRRPACTKVYKSWTVHSSHLKFIFVQRFVFRNGRNRSTKMRPLIILLLISSCGRQTGKLDNTTLTDNKDAGLYSLLDKLPKLKTPLTFNSGRQIIIDSLLGGDNELIKKIRTIDPGFNPYAKIYQTDDFIAVITISAADILMPVLATFDKKGQLQALTWATTQRTS